MSIKKKKTKRLSPYLESELWEKDELLSIIKYEQHLRDRAALTSLWDFNARNHEVTLLKLKHIRLRERYGEGVYSIEYYLLETEAIFQAANKSDSGILENIEGWIRNERENVEKKIIPPKDVLRDIWQRLEVGPYHDVDTAKR